MRLHMSSVAFAGHFSVTLLLKMSCASLRSKSRELTASPRSSMSVQLSASVGSLGLEHSSCICLVHTSHSRNSHGFGQGSPIVNSNSGFSCVASPHPPLEV